MSQTQLTSGSTPHPDSATARFGLRPAPVGLELVQEFLNTRGIADHNLTDLLADRETARTWLRQATARWAQDRGADAPTIVLSPADLRELRALRGVFERMSAHGEGVDIEPQPPVAATLVPGADGMVELAPAGVGWHWLASALWIEIFRAQQEGTWPRLKLCRNDSCASAFYDTSRNNSGVWHNVRTCGNVANLRASRERRRAREADAI